MSRFQDKLEALGYGMIGGTPGNDTAGGGLGEQAFFAYQGNDTFAGHEGNDIFVAGSGRDTMVFTNTSSNNNGDLVSEGHDVFIGYQYGVDRFDFTDDPLVNSLNDLEFSTSPLGVHVDYDGGSILLLNADVVNFNDFLF